MTNTTTTQTLRNASETMRRALFMAGDSERLMYAALARHDEEGAARWRAQANVEWSQYMSAWEDLVAARKALAAQAAQAPRMSPCYCDSAYHPAGHAL